MSMIACVLEPLVPSNTTFADPSPARRNVSPFASVSPVRTLMLDVAGAPLMAEATVL